VAMAILAGVESAACALVSGAGVDGVLVRFGLEVVGVACRGGEGVCVSRSTVGSGAMEVRGLWWVKKMANLPLSGWWC
jgi:hypothetical protein